MGLRVNLKTPVSTIDDACSGFPWIDRRVKSPEFAYPRERQRYPENDGCRRRDIQSRWRGVNARRYREKATHCHDDYQQNQRGRNFMFE